MIDGLIDLESFLEIAYPPLAGCNHKFPLHLIRLNLAGSFQIEAGLLVEALLDVVDS